MDNLERLPSSSSFQMDIHVLLIEDNPADARLFKEYLAEEYTLLYTLTHVARLADALDMMQRMTPDVIVLDLSLPDAQGLEGLRMLTDSTPDVPVVVHSGSDDQLLIEEAVKQGAQDYLVKGRYVPDLLHRVLRYAIERQQSLREVQDSEQRLRSIIEHTSDGVVIVNADKLVVFANPAAEHLLGLTTTDLLGKPFDFHLAINETTEHKITQPGGPLLTVEMRSTPIMWKSQPAYLASLRDITAHKRLQAHLTRAKEEAEELARLKSSFLASMSHELRTPLTGVMGFADTLINELTNQQHRDFATIIKKAGERLLATINSVLDLSQLEAGTVKVKKQPVSVTDVAREVLSLLEPLAKEKGLSLNLTTHTPDAFVLADKILLQRILDNLVGNAIKFTEKGSVHVEVKAEDEHVWIRVKDTGQGIDPAFKPYLFEQFSQESDGLRRTHPGSGLGLAITKKLVELLGGVIMVDSEVGAGSTFGVSLPGVAQPPLTHISDLEPVRPPTENNRARVLVAEDNYETRHLIKHILEQHYEVTLASDGETALDLIEKASYDALLLDIQLSGPKTGVDVLNAVRARMTHHKTPAVAMTAFSITGDEPYFQSENGFDGFMRKPFTRDQLLRTMQQAIAFQKTSIPMKRKGRST